MRFHLSAFFLATVSARLTERELSEPKIFSFTPKTKVTDHAAIDLDQQEIETHLGGTEKDFGKARSVYENGANSKSVAILTTSPLPTSVTQRQAASGLSAAGETVTGSVYLSADSGDVELQIQYDTLADHANYVQCQVGGSAFPNTAGCFADSGNIDLDGTSVAYTAVTNVNGRTIRGFGTDNDKHRKGGQGDYYEDFDQFQSYYGTPQYADDWVTAALSGTATGFDNGNADFSAVGEASREQAIKKGTAYLSIFMYVIRELEDALDDCERGCDTDECNEDAVHALDEAVAFYSGSLTVTENGNGILLYALAEKRCANFLTCEDGEARVNTNIFTLFRRMQNNLVTEDCTAAREDKEAITKQMYVPMIQGTLRYAYISGEEDDQSEKPEAEGATFAAAVLPKVHKCSPADAAIIYDNMRIAQSTPVDFVAVKEAFERNYDCLGITCEDVGGLGDGELYFDKAAPCGVSEGSSGSVSTAFSAFMTTVAGLLI